MQPKREILSVPDMGKWKRSQVDLNKNFIFAFKVFN